MSGSEQVNTRSSGSARVDDITGHPQGEIRGQTKLVKVTEDVRKYAAEHGLTDAEAIESGMQEKRKEWSRAGMRRHRRVGPRGRERGERLSQFLEKGAEVYVNG